MRSDLRNASNIQTIVNHAGNLLAGVCVFMYFRHTAQEFMILMLCVFYF